MYNFSVDQVCYSIPLDVDFTVAHLDEVDSALGLAGMQTTLDSLEKIDGVSNIEFNGMFGNFVFLRISFNHNNDQTKAKISDIITLAKNRYRKNIKNKPYLVYLDSVVAINTEDAAQAFANNVYGNVEWVDDDSFGLRLGGARNIFEHILIDNKNGSFGIFSSN